MGQIVDSIVRTCLGFTDKYGQWIILGVVGIAGVTLVLNIVARIVNGGGPPKDR